MILVVDSEAWQCALLYQIMVACVLVLERLVELYSDHEIIRSRVISKQANKQKRISTKTIKLFAPTQLL